jgi:hypothetical protein
VGDDQSAVASVDAADAGSTFVRVAGQPASMHVTALDVALAGVFGTLLAPVLAGWVERSNARRRHELERQLARDNLNFAERKTVYAELITSAQRMNVSMSRLHTWTQVGGEPPDLLELPEDEEQAFLSAGIATFASEQVTEKAQAFWHAFFAYLDTGPGLHAAIEEGKTGKDLARLRSVESAALANAHAAAKELRAAVRDDLAVRCPAGGRRRSQFTWSCPRISCERTARSPASSAGCSRS